MCYFVTLLCCYFQVGFNNRKIFMGYYGSPGDAARAYDRKVVQLHGALGEAGWTVFCACHTIWFKSNMITMEGGAAARCAG